jgi:hypothetical protein
MTTALLDWISLCSHDPFEVYCKVATVWYDKLIWQVPRPEMIEGVIQDQVEQRHMSSGVADELLRLCVPIQSQLPGYRFVENALERSDPHLSRIAFEVAAEIVRGNHPDVSEEDYGFQREVSWVGVGLIDTVTAWSALRSSEGCQLLATEYEQRVFHEAFGAVVPHDGFELFSEVALHEIPDFAQMSWEAVFELRHHPFLQQFRTKLFGLQQMLDSEEHRNGVDLVDEIQRHDLEEIARLARPNIGRTIIKGVVSNFPLPIPINPASLGLSIKDVVTAYEQKRRFGWLYFLMDLRHLSK